MEEWSRVRRILILCHWESDISDKEQEEEHHTYVFPKYWLPCHGLPSPWFCLDALNGCSSRVSFWGWEMGDFLPVLHWGVQTLIVYGLYLKSLIFELLSSSYISSSCLDCHHLQTSCMFTEVPDIQFSI